LKYYAKKVEKAHREHSNLNLLPHLCLASMCDILSISQHRESLKRVQVFF
jgi:hypothetical protein